MLCTSVPFLNSFTKFYVTSQSYQDHLWNPLPPQVLKLLPMTSCISVIYPHWHHHYHSYWDWRWTFCHTQGRANAKCLNASQRGKWNRRTVFEFLLKCCALFVRMRMGKARVHHFLSPVSSLTSERVLRYWLSQIKLKERQVITFALQITQGTKHGTLNISEHLLQLFL